MSVPLFARAAAVASTLLSLAVLPALAADAPAPVPAPVTGPNVTTAMKNVQWIFTGYVQGRFTDTFARQTVAESTSAPGDVFAVPPSNFAAQRAYIVLDAVVNPHIDGVLNVSLAPSSQYVSLLEGYGQYTFNQNFRARLGLSRIPYGYETPLSSASLITLERSEAIRTLLSNSFTFDRGLFGYYKPLKHGVSVSIAATDGTTTTPPAAGTFPADPNGHKDLIARVGYTAKNLEAGASMYAGTSPFDIAPAVKAGPVVIPADTTMNRAGYDVEYANKGLTVLSEGIWAKDNDTNSNGAYATIAYQKPGYKGQPYLRLDYFNDNTDVDNDVYKRATVGFNYYLNRNTKLTLEFQAINNKVSVATIPLGDKAPYGNSGVVLAQYQVIF